MKLSAFLLVFLAACGGTVLIDTAPGNDAGAGNDSGTTPTADGGNPVADGGTPIACPATTTELFTLTGANEPSIDALAVDDRGNVAFTYPREDSQRRLVGFNVANPAKSYALENPENGVTGIGSSVVVEGGVAYFVGKGALRKVGFDDQPSQPVGTNPAGIAAIGGEFTQGKAGALFGDADNGTDNGLRALFRFHAPSEITAMTHDGVGLTFFAGFDRGFIAIGRSNGALYTGLDINGTTTREDTQGHTMQAPIGVLSTTGGPYAYWTERKGGVETIVRTIIPSLDPTDRSTPAPIDVVASTDTDLLQSMAVLGLDDVLVASSCKQCVRRAATLRRFRAGAPTSVAGDGIEGHTTDDISALTVRGGCAFWAEVGSGSGGRASRIYWRKL